MMDDNERGTANKFGGTSSGRTNQPTGPIAKQYTMGQGANIGIEDMWPFIVALYYFTGCRWEAK